MPSVNELRLPAQIATKPDLVAVIRNLDQVLNAYIENSVRRYEGVDFASRPDVSSNLATLIKENNLEVTIETLKGLKQWLSHLQDHAPVVRFVFASDPTPQFLTKLVLWLRGESGRFVLVRYGVQPTIAAGCLMYTPARRYDFSLRKHLLTSGAVFSKVLARTMTQAQPAGAASGE